MLHYKNHFDTKSLDPFTLEKGFEAVLYEAVSGEVGYYHLPLSSQALVFPPDVRGHQQTR